MSWNVLRNRVVAEGNIYPHLLQSHHCQIWPNGWIHPCPLLLMFGDHAHHQLHCTVVKPFWGISPTGGWESMSWTQRGGSLAPPPHRISTPFFFLLLPFPRSLIAVSIYLRPLGVSFHRQTIVVGGQQCSSLVPEQRDRRQ